MVEEAKKLNAEVIAVLPNKIKIAVDKLEEFRIAEESLKIGSYLKISDNENTGLVAVISNYLIEVDEEGNRKYVIESNPLGTLKDGEFKRGGDELAIPPKEAAPLKKEEVRQIYETSIEENKKFSFAKLSRDRDISVPVDGNRFFNKHIAIVGATGSGKSCTVARILQNAKNVKTGNYEGLNNSHIVIFDIHSEYKKAFPQVKLIDVNNLILPYWLLNGDELEELFLESGDRNNYNQASVMREIVTSNKEKHNSSVEKVCFDSPLMFDIDEVCNCLYNLSQESTDYNNSLTIKFQDEDKTFDSEKEKLNEYFQRQYAFKNPARSAISRGIYADGSIDKFVSRFKQKKENKRLTFLLGQKSKEISFESVLQNLLSYDDTNKSNITVIDVSGIPFEVLSITISLITRILFDYTYYSKKINVNCETPLLLVFEEAHKYVPKSDLSKYRASQMAIERVAKEGRKYGVTLLIASQRPSEISETIFSQCSNFIAMRLTNPDDQNYVKRLLPDMLGPMTETLPALEAGEALLIGDSVIMPSLVYIDKGDPEPSSSDIPYLDIWKEKWKGVKFVEIVQEWKK